MRKFLILVGVTISIVAAIAFCAVGCNEYKPSFGEVLSTTDNITMKTVTDNLKIDISLLKKNNDVITITESADIVRSVSGDTAYIDGSTRTTYADNMVSSLLKVAGLMGDMSAITSFFDGTSSAVFNASVKDGLINVGANVTEEEDYILSRSNIIGGIKTEDFDKFFSDTHIESLSDMTVSKMFTTALSSWASKSTDMASAKKNSDGSCNYSYKVEDYATFVEDYFYTFLDTIFVDKENSGYSDITRFYTSIKDVVFSHFVPTTTTLNAVELDGKLTSLNAKGGFALKFTDDVIISIVEYFGMESSEISNIMSLLHALSIGTADGKGFELIIDFDLNESFSYDAVSFDSATPIFEERDFTEIEKYGIITVATNAVASYFNTDSNAETDAFKEKYGIIKGISHGVPTEQGISNLLEANIEYVRKDTRFPYKFDANGNVTDIPNPRYLQFKEDCRQFQAAGIKVIACTPCPRDYNIDWEHFDSEDEQYIKDIALFYMNDLNGLVDCIQIGNELDAVELDVVVTNEQAAYFVGTNAKIMSTVKEEYNIIVGYNSILGGGNYNKAMQPYLEYMDYAGIDIYFGNFDTLTKEMYLHNIITRYMWNITKKPIVIMEFGYISEGKTKTLEEKQEILRSYGYENEDEAKADIVNFVSKWPSSLNSIFTRNNPDQSTWVAKIFETPFYLSEIKNHFYCELGNCFLRGYDHTLEGQAKFYRDLIPSLMAENYISGLVIFNYADDPGCWKCGQEDCPIEGKWGIVDKEGNRKPSWYTVQEAFEE